MTREVDHRFEAAGVARRSLRLLVTTRPVARLSARYLPKADSLTARVTGGRFIMSAWLTGLPILELTTTGARSGIARTHRVLGVPANQGYVVVGANFGQRTNPNWVYNIRAHSTVTVTIDARARQFVARELSGARRSNAFDAAVALNPGWLRFQRQAGSREIPVFELRPVITR